MKHPRIASRDDWLRERLTLLEKEKALTRARDAVNAQRRELPWSVIAPFRARMGWRFNWVSAASCSFGYDYHVDYTPAQLAAGETFYNYRPGLAYGEHSPGISVFTRDATGQVYHTYSCYARGLDALNGTYQLLDLLPNGRAEDRLPSAMDWVRLHDEYPPAD
ncbi:MAG: DUF899 family protein [Pseudomonadales bacterium]